ncbi:DUF1194 domain-containing protein [Aestuariispira ectoiniformans]|uniref:DUF1194 domain-containing protein n=1 Tax=Aestuariispira ectoiniformans TaxID=2775080 RepID=UPI00223AADEB|nr:DUF1194 domain-containing protein [Aestuariispira ectoiniformans]
MKLKLMKGLLTAGALAVAAFIGQANAGVIGLALVVDGSGSINSSEWSLQMQGYKNAINAAIPTDSSIAISGTQFATSASVFQTMTTVNGGNKGTIANTFGSQGQFGGVTCISCGIYAAFQDAMLSGLSFDKLIIDVSTDGAWNQGHDPDGGAGVVGSAEWAIAQGADVVNCLGVGGGADCSFIAGTGAFAVASADFNDFEKTLLAKIRRETGQNVPAPATLGLLGLGLLALSLYRRRVTA